MDALCERDRAVLQSILDPSGALGPAGTLGPDGAPTDDDRYDEPDDEPSSPAAREAAALRARGAALAGTRPEEALALLTQAAEAAPDAAAVYNDRAQLYRLMSRDEEARADLGTALRLTEGRRGRARALALCQLGALRRRAGDAAGARRAFAEAAALGSSFARKQCVEMNPYAALCNQMLSQVLKGEKVIHL